LHPSQDTQGMEACYTMKLPRSVWW
jgi:hypothetical protein